METTGEKNFKPKEYLKHLCKNTFDSRNDERYWRGRCTWSLDAGHQRHERHLDFISFCALGVHRSSLIFCSFVSREEGGS